MRPARYLSVFEEPFCRSARSARPAAGRVMRSAPAGVSMIGLTAPHNRPNQGGGRRKPAGAHPDNRQFACRRPNSLFLQSTRPETLAIDVLVTGPYERRLADRRPMLTRFRQPGRLLLAFARLTCYNEFLFFRYNGSGAFLELPSSPGALLRLFLSTCASLLALALGGPAFAQDDVPSAPIETAGRWEPLGQVPVDQAGAGRRGYALPGESADVAEPGTNQIGLHMVAANNFFREQTNDFLITQRY